MSVGGAVAVFSGPQPGDDVSVQGDGWRGTGECIQVGIYSIAVQYRPPGPAAADVVEWFNWVPGLKRHGIRHGDTADEPVRLVVDEEGRIVGV